MEPVTISKIIGSGRKRSGKRKRRSIPLIDNTFIFDCEVFAYDWLFSFKNKVTKAVKEYAKERMLTWYNKLHTDSSEYKMWGNGIALPCALYVMQGITSTESGL